MSGSATNEMRDQINERLESFDSTEGYTRAIEIERAAMLEFRIEQSNPLRLAYDGKVFLEEMATAIERSQQPFMVTYPDQERTGSLSRYLNPNGGMADTYNRLRKSIGRHQCLIRSLRIINALESQSESIDEASITTELQVGCGVPAEMTLDPFTGKLVTIMRIGDQWQVYSLGPNQTDDCGPSDEIWTEFGLGPKNEAEKTEQEKIAVSSAFAVGRFNEQANSNRAGKGWTVCHPT